MKRAAAPKGTAAREVRFEMAATASGRSRLERGPKVLAVSSEVAIDLGEHRPVGVPEESTHREGIDTAFKKPRRKAMPEVIEAPSLPVLKAKSSNLGPPSVHHPGVLLAG